MRVNACPRRHSHEHTRACAQGAHARRGACACARLLHPYYVRAGDRASVCARCHRVCVCVRACLCACACVGVFACASTFLRPLGDARIWLEACKYARVSARSCPCVRLCTCAWARPTPRLRCFVRIIACVHANAHCSTNAQTHVSRSTCPRTRKGLTRMHVRKQSSSQIRTLTPPFPRTI